VGKFHIKPNEAEKVLVNRKISEELGVVAQDTISMMMKNCSRA
jgi:hypothetical protein